MSADIERFEAIGTDEDPRMVPTRVGPWVRFTDYEATIGRLTGECEASMDTIARERARADAILAALVERLTRERDRYASDAGERAAKLDAAEAKIEWLTKDLAQVESSLAEVEIERDEDWRRANAAEAALAKAREALRKARWHVAAANEAEHMLDGFEIVNGEIFDRIMPRPTDALLAEIDAALAPEWE